MPKAFGMGALSQFQELSQLMGQAVGVGKLGDLRPADRHYGQSHGSHLVAPLEIVGHLLESSVMPQAVVLKGNALVGPEEVRPIALLGDERGIVLSRSQSWVEGRSGQCVSAQGQRQRKKHC
ncbi:hypothetical protein, partial [uncultured Adlercreutzia sp.]|uniref:hypothetical protein n=1 Tax=uncultured Adlercreutzia sp. TaxID=875803 RepID=UPI0025A4ED98